MTLSEAIKHAEEVAEENEHDATIWKKTKQTKEVERCKKCAAEHRQLAEWLKELKVHREQKVFDKIRAEIEEYKSRVVFGIGIKDLETGKQIAIDYILGIIDKYKAESEVKDGNDN